MCQSIADGGRRCFTHTKHAGPDHWKEKAKKAKHAGDKDALNEAMVEYYTTEEGIEKLENKGEYEKAENSRKRRNRLIDEYNQEYGYNMPHFPARTVRLERKRKQAAANAKKPVWSKAGIHRDTGTRFSPRRWSQDKKHELTGDIYDPEGYDIEGYGKDGFHKETGLDRQGYGRDGYDVHGRNRAGRNRGGYDRRGLDEHGWTVEGWNFEGTLHRDTGTNLDPDTFDVNDWSPIHKMFRHEWEQMNAAQEPAHV